MSVKLYLDGDGFKYENEDITLQQAAQIVAFVNSSQNPPQVVNSQLPPVTLVSNQQNNNFGSVRQVIDSTNAKTVPQKIAAIAKYLQDKGQAVFTRTEIMENLRRAGERLPKNIGRDLKDSIKSDYICESDSQRDEYYLTNKGLTEVENGFASSKSIGAGKKTSKRTTSGKKSTSPDNIKLTDIKFQPIWAGYPHFHNDLKTKSDKMLWVLGCCKSQGVEEMTAIDISYVLGKLGVVLSSSDVTSNSRTHTKEGRLYKNSNMYNIEPVGEEYLKSLLS